MSRSRHPLTGIPTAIDSLPREPFREALRGAILIREPGKNLLYLSSRAAQTTFADQLSHPPIFAHIGEHERSFRRIVSPVDSSEIRELYGLQLPDAIADALQRDVTSPHAFKFKSVTVLDSRNAASMNVEKRERAFVEAVFNTHTPSAETLPNHENTWTGRHSANRASPNSSHRSGGR